METPIYTDTTYEIGYLRIVHENQLQMVEAMLELQSFSYESNVPEEIL